MVNVGFSPMISNGFSANSLGRNEASTLPKTDSMFAPKSHGDIQGQEGIFSRAFWLVLGREGPSQKLHVPTYKV